MSMLWPEADDDSARHSLRNTLYDLRRSLGDKAILSHGESFIELNPDRVTCDAVQLREAVHRRDWAAALAVYEGELAPGFHVDGTAEFEEWLERQRTGLQLAVQEAAWARVDELEQQCDMDAVAAAQRAWELNRSDEAGARRLMRLLRQHFGVGAMRELYEQLAAHLQSEFGTTPDRLTRQLYDELLAPHESSRRSQPVGAVDLTDAAEPPVAPATRNRRPLPFVPLVAALTLLLGLAGHRLMRAPETSALPPLPFAPLPPRYRADTSAYGSYLRGVALRFGDETEASRDTFAALVQRHPTYAPGLAGLAHAYILSSYEKLPPREAFPLAEAAARQALLLDSTLSQSWTALGAIALWRRQLDTAGIDIARGIALAPDDPEAHAIRGNWFRWRSLPESALAEVRRVQQLDRLHPMWLNYVARQYIWLREYPAAESLYRQVLRDYPKRATPLLSLSLVYRLQGRWTDAAEMVHAAQRQGDPSIPPLSPIQEEAEAHRVLDSASHARLDRFARRARAGEYVPSSQFVLAYAELGDTVNLLRWLDSMESRREPATSNYLLNPLLDFVRDDPRYRAWVTGLSWRAKPSH
jgi:DNA-binding SARP family transcriptional activator/Flp pilus assembly protein TadD